MPRLERPQPRVDEQSIVNAIRTRLGLERDLWLWRNAQAYGERWNPKTAQVRGFRGGLGKGTSDIIGILSVGIRTGPEQLVQVGRFWAFEVKCPGEKPTASQQEFLRLVRLFGGFGGWGNSVDGAVAALERARRGESE